MKQTSKATPQLHMPCFILPVTANNKHKTKNKKHCLTVVLWAASRPFTLVENLRKPSLTHPLYTHSQDKFFTYPPQCH